MTRPLAAARLLIIALLFAASPACASLNLAAPAVAAPAPHALGPPLGPQLGLVGGSPGQRVQAAGPSADSTTVLDINGSGAIRLHNRFLAGGLILYIAVMVAALVFLEKRRAAAVIIFGAGVILGGLLLVRAFG